MSYRRKPRGAPAIHGLAGYRWLAALGVVAMVLLFQFFSTKEPDWAAAYRGDASAARWSLRKELQRVRNASLLGEDLGLGGQRLWECSLQLLELAAAFRSQPGRHPEAKLSRVYRAMLVSRQLMEGLPADPPAAYAALEEAGAELGFQLGDTGIFEEAHQQLGSDWHRPSPHVPACAEEMSLLLAMREGRGARLDLLEARRSPEEWLAHMLPAFDSSRELETFEHLGGHIEVATLQNTGFLGLPVVMWALPAGESLKRIAVWSHAIVFDSAGERLAWRMAAMEENGCLLLGVGPDKPLLHDHEIGVQLRLILGNGTSASETKLANSQGMFSIRMSPGTYTSRFPSRASCIPMPSANSPGMEIVMAALFYARQPTNEALRLVPSVTLAANKYYRVHAPDFLQRYRLPPATPGFTHSRLLASGVVHKMLKEAGFGGNPTTSLATLPMCQPVWLGGAPTAPGGRRVPEAAASVVSESPRETVCSMGSQSGGHHGGGNASGLVHILSPGAAAAAALAVVPLPSLLWPLLWVLVRARKLLQRPTGLWRSRALHITRYMMPQPGIDTLDGWGEMDAPTAEAAWASASREGGSES